MSMKQVVWAAGLSLAAALAFAGAGPASAEPGALDPVAADRLGDSTPAGAAAPKAPDPAAAASIPSQAAAPAATTAASPAAATPTPATAAAPTPAPAAPAPTTATAAPAAPVTTGAIPAPVTAPASSGEAPQPAITTPATTEPAAGVPSEAVQAATPPPAPVDPIVAEIRKRLDDAAFTGRAANDDVDALKAFYGGAAAPVWTKDGAFTAPAQAIIAELGKADDWGLNASDYFVPTLAPGAAADAQGAAEARLALMALKYARDARGGRVNPRAISSIWDVGGEIKDPNAVLKELATSGTPDGVLRDCQPKQPGFEALRQALLKTRAAGEPAPEPVDEALSVKLSEDKKAKLLKVGIEDDDVVLLRKRLKVAAADGSDERIYDETLAEAVRGYQSNNGIKATGVLNRTTRRVLNREGEPKAAPDKTSAINNLIVNMERWRWLPSDMGSLYVWANVPEYTGRVMKDNETVFEQRIIVGMPTWPTPMLTDSLEMVVFNPEWGVPDGIKVKELLPRLKQASGGDFFEQLFGGGSSGGARVLAAYGLKPSLNGQPVDANSINWNNVDIRRFSFVQPAGAQNPLGRVKFMFPNRHDVYMHDTSQKPLFAQSRRALSHGCIRVQNPDKLAEVLLGADKGWSRDRVDDQFRSGGQVTLEKPVPVYLTYFTARADADGTVKTFADIYGNDSRVLSALAGRPVRYTPPDHTGEDITDDATISQSSDPANDVPQVSAPSKKASKQAKKKQPKETGDMITDALSGLLFN